MVRRGRALAEEVNKQTLLADVRDDLVRDGYPNVFIDRLLGLVDECFSLEDIKTAKRPEDNRLPTIALSAGVMTAVLAVAIRAEQPGLLDVGFGLLFMLPFIPLSVWLARRQIRGKGFHDDVMLVFLRAATGGMMGLSMRRFLRRRGVETQADVDNAIGKWGWRATGSYRSQALIWGLVTLAYLVVMLLNSAG